MCSAPRGASALERRRAGNGGRDGGRMFTVWDVGGRWTRREVSSSVRWSLLLAARARTSESCGRWAEAVKSERSVGG